MRSTFPQNVLICGGLLILAVAFPVFGQKFADPPIDKRPPADPAFKIADQVRRGVLDLTKHFLLEMRITSGKEVTYLRSEGDPKMILLVKDAVASFVEKGYFKYAEELSVSELLIAVKQDDTDLSIMLSGELPSEAKARNIVSALNVGNAVFEQSGKEPEASYAQKQRALFHKNVSFRAVGKQVEGTFQMRKLEFWSAVVPEISIERPFHGVQ